MFRFRSFPVVLILTAALVGQTAAATTVSVPHPVFHPVPKPVAAPAVDKIVDQFPAEQRAAILAIKRLGGKVTYDVTGSTPAVSAVVLSGNYVPESSLLYVLKLPTITRLEFGPRDISDASLTQIKLLPLLQTLHLSGRSSVGQLGAVHRLTPEGLAPLTELPDLRDLDLSYTGLTNAALPIIGKLTRLESLNLAGNSLTGGAFSHDVYKPFEKLTELRSLDLSYTQLSGKALPIIGKLTRLESLKLRSNPLTDEGFKHLAGLTNLHYLDLGRTKISDAGLDSLKGLVKLEGLYLDKDYRAPNLIMFFLPVSPESFSDDGLAKLSVLTQLRLLCLTNTNPSTAALARLATDLPKAAVYSATIRPVVRPTPRPRPVAAR